MAQLDEPHTQHSCNPKLNPNLTLILIQHPCNSNPPTLTHTVFLTQHSCTPKPKPKLPVSPPKGTTAQGAETHTLTLTKHDLSPPHPQPPPHPFSFFY